MPPVFGPESSRQPERLLNRRQRFMDEILVELGDRWRLPLRGSRVTAVDWHDHDFVLSFDCGMELVAAYSMRLSSAFRVARDDCRPIAQCSRPDAEQRLRSSKVVSSVAFRVGELRIGFCSGLTLRALSTDPVCPARIRVGGQVLCCDASRPDDTSGPVDCG